MLSMCRRNVAEGLGRHLGSTCIVDTFVNNCCAPFTNNNGSRFWSILGASHSGSPQMCVSLLLLLGPNQSPADVPGVIKVVMLRALEVNNGILGHESVIRLQTSKRL